MRLHCLQLTPSANGWSYGGSSLGIACDTLWPPRQVGPLRNPRLYFSGVVNTSCVLFSSSSKLSVSLLCLILWYTQGHGLAQCCYESLDYAGLFFLWGLSAPTVLGCCTSYLLRLDRCTGRTRAILDSLVRYFPWTRAGIKTRQGPAKLNSARIAATSSKLACTSDQHGPGPFSARRSSAIETGAQARDTAA